MNALRDAALISKAWPYEEARKLLKRYPDGIFSGLAKVRLAEIEIKTRQEVAIMPPQPAPISGLMLTG